MNNLEQNLNELLSDLNVFFRKLQNYHWNVEGMDFFQMHEKLEEYYNEISVSIDEIAEHIIILGGQPFGRMEDYLNTTTIVEAKNEKIKSINPNYNAFLKHSVKPESLLYIACFDNKIDIVCGEQLIELVYKDSSSVGKEYLDWELTNNDIIGLLDEECAAVYLK